MIKSVLWFCAKIIMLFVTLAGALSGLLSFIEYFMAEKEFKSLTTSLLSASKIIFMDWQIILALAVITLILYYWNALLYYVASLSPFRLKRAIKEMHNMEHVVERSITAYNNLSPEQKRIGHNSTRKIIGDILEAVSRVVSAVYGEHVSIHIKLFKSEQKHGDPLDSVEHSTLQAYERYPSRQEDDLVLSGKLHERSDNEQYIIILSNDGDPKVLEAQSQAGTEFQSRNKRVNSAYNHVLGDGKHYWVGSNLSKENYFSTSEGWKKSYQSLAVFLIAPVQKKHGGRPDAALGLLIADSPKKYTFINKRLLRNLLGYCTHRFHAILKIVLDQNTQIHTDMDLKIQNEFIARIDTQTAMVPQRIERKSQNKSIYLIYDSQNKGKKKKKKKKGKK